MNKPVIALALASTVVAAAMIWFGFDQLDGGAVPSSASTARPISRSTSDRHGEPSTDDPPSSGPSFPKTESQVEAPSRTEGHAPASADIARQNQQQVAPTGVKIDKLIPQTADGTDADARAKDPDAEESLGRSGRIVCEFSAGNDIGAFDGQLRSASASWQGGPITYDPIDFDAGTAQMIGSVGATGSTEGHADARVILRGPRLEFLVPLSSGGIVLTTVFGERRDKGGYVAVMSRHEGLRSQGAGTYGAQFLGFCR